MKEVRMTIAHGVSETDVDKQENRNTRLRDGAISSLFGVTQCWKVYRKRGVGDKDFLFF